MEYFAYLYRLTQKLLLLSRPVIPDIILSQIEEVKRFYVKLLFFSSNCDKIFLSRSL